MSSLVEDIKQRSTGRLCASARRYMFDVAALRELLTSPTVFHPTLEVHAGVRGHGGWWGTGRGCMTGCVGNSVGCLVADMAATEGAPRLGDEHPVHDRVCAQSGQKLHELCQSL